MSTTEHAVQRGRRISGLHSPRVRHVRASLLLVLTAWTAYWAQSAVGMAREYSTIGRGMAGPTIDAHEVFELVFVTSYALVRWAPVALGIFAVWLGAGWLLRRRRASAAP